MRPRLILLLILVHGFPLAACAGLWTSDYESALKKAKEENRHVLLDFSGSDWCGWCIRLQKEVFSTTAFQDFASKHLICVEIDFPRKTQLPQDIRERNFQLRKQFGVRGYPAIFLLGPDGVLVARTGYQAGGGEAYVSHLKDLIRRASDRTHPPDSAELSSP